MSTIVVIAIGDVSCHFVWPTPKISRGQTFRRSTKMFNLGPREAKKEEENIELKLLPNEHLSQNETRYFVCQWVSVERRRHWWNLKPKPNRSIRFKNVCELSTATHTRSLWIYRTSMWEVIINGIATTDANAKPTDLNVVVVAAFITQRRQNGKMNCEKFVHTHTHIHRHTTPKSMPLIVSFAHVIQTNTHYQRP